MASNINPNNIDGSYPVAGQDNNSQGFRDNFTNIKVNFQYAEEEINDLESNAILKAALTGATLDNNMSNNTIYAVNLNDVSTTRIAATGTSGTVTLNYASGQYQTVAPSTGSITLAFTNFPASGYFGSLRVAIVVTNTAYTVTLPAAVTLGTTGLQGYSGGVITFATTGTFVFDFSTSDGGTTVTINDVTRPMSLYTNGFGYTTGAGSTVTQTVSRTTGVTIDAVSGAITLVSAAGSSSYNTFTVTNNKVAATDVIIVNQKSGTDKYEAFVTAVGAGSFAITFSDVSGTTTEQPVFSFVVIKGATS
jgi:hypothetical protein